MPRRLRVQYRPMGPREPDRAGLVPKYSDDGPGGWVPMHVRDKTDRDGPCGRSGSWDPARATQPRRSGRKNGNSTGPKQISRFHETSHRYLNFKGMGTLERVPLQISLMDLYVPLEARIEMPEGECWARDLKLAGRRSLRGGRVHGRAAQQARLGRRSAEKHDGLVVLGDPGAGKNHLIKYLALREAGRENRERMPVLIPLSAYANALAEQDGISLSRFMEKYYREQLDADLP